LCTFFGHHHYACFTDKGLSVAQFFSIAT
jgi:hypothetical protein